MAIDFVYKPLTPIVTFDKPCQCVSFFNRLSEAPPIKDLTKEYYADERPEYPFYINKQKVNLSVDSVEDGAYRTDDSKPYVLPVVRRVESQLSQDDKANHEYLPVAGLTEFRSACIKLLLGDDSKALDRADGIQAIGGTGAVRIGMDFLRSKMGYDTIYVSNPTWGNHIGIAKMVGFPNIRTYRYWDNENRQIDFANMIDDLRNAPVKSVVLLHMCAHNPTGMDPTMDQWKEIAAVVEERRLFPFFDCAYQGFSSGDVDQDAASIRYFVDQGFEMLRLSPSLKTSDCTMNESERGVQLGVLFLFIDERIGQLTFIADSPKHIPKIRSQLVMIVRETWSNPPTHGAKIVSAVLNNPELLIEWKETVKMMAERIQSMRKLLFDNLTNICVPGTWDHIVKQSGMFSYTGLTTPQAEYLIKEYHIYLLRDGRINMCAITTKNAEYVAKAINDAVSNY